MKKRVMVDLKTEISDLDFLLKMGNSLTELERLIEENLELKSTYPNVYILGLPRSGTTLLAQILFNNSDLKCTNNLMARFWTTPLVGAKLSKIINPNSYRSNYSNNLGTTIGVDQPHEFTNFWWQLLKIKSMNPGVVYQSAIIDWNVVRSKIYGLNELLDAPLVHKPLELVAFNIDGFLENLNNSIFIYIERDLCDVAYSLYEARIKKNGTPDIWWGSMPNIDQFRSLLNVNFIEQIVGQVNYLNDLYNTVVNKIPGNMLVKTSYDEICSNPNKIMYDISKKIKVSIPGFQYSNTLQAFKITHKKKKQDIQDKFKSLIN